MTIAMLGGGSWAIALAALLDKAGFSIRMWEVNTQDAEMLRTRREHAKKLPGVRIADRILITSDVAEALDTADYVVSAMPSQVTRSALAGMAAACDRSCIDRVQAWIIVSKGIECSTLKLLSDVFVDEIPGLTQDKIVILSGPSHAEEVSKNIPTTVVAASQNSELALAVQNQFSTEYFRIYTNSDPIGVQLCASVKNVIALAAGISDGLGFGDNTKGALLTRGMAEMARLGTRMGAQQSTFSGLAGFGDLITTCISKHSRNRNLGELIARGMSLQDAIAKIGMVAEGVESTRAVCRLAQKFDIHMPISTEVYRALFEGKPAIQAVKDLMLRQSKPEHG